MNRGVVIKEDSVWQGHPDVAYFNERLYIVYRESDKHLTMGGTKIKVLSGKVLREELAYLTDPIVVAQSPHRLNCPRLSIIGNTLWLICDEVLGNEDYIRAENVESQTRVFLWKTLDGEHWEGPLFTNITGIVPDRICQMEDEFFIATHTQSGPEHRYPNMLIQNVWKTRDLSKANWNKYCLASSPEYHFCEASLFVYDKKLICLMRENSNRGLPAFLSIYEKNDGIYDERERVWSDPSPTRLFGCHRPVSGVLKSGKVLTTYREASHSWRRGCWAKNTFAQLCELTSFDMRYGVILPLDHDRGAKSDSGYTGWVQLSDESIFVVNYITNDAPKPYIVWYLIREEDF